MWLTGWLPMPVVLGLCSLSYLVAWGLLRVWANPDWLERVFGPSGTHGKDGQSVAVHGRNATRAPVEGLLPAAAHGG